MSWLVGTRADRSRKPLAARRAKRSVGESTQDAAMMGPPQAPRNAPPMATTGELTGRAARSKAGARLEVAARNSALGCRALVRSEAQAAERTAAPSEKHWEPASAARWMLGVATTEPARVVTTEPAEVGTTGPQRLRWSPRRSESARGRPLPSWRARRGAWPSPCRAVTEACLRDRS